MHFPQGRDLRPNSNFTINCTVDGYPRPTVNWFKDGQMLVPTDRIHITDAHQLMVFGAIPSDTGRYKCLARNEMSEAFQENSIHVEGTIPVVLVVAELYNGFFYLSLSAFYSQTQVYTCRRDVPTISSLPSVT